MSQQIDGTMLDESKTQLGFILSVVTTFAGSSIFYFGFRRYMMAVGNSNLMTYIAAVSVSFPEAQIFMNLGLVLAATGLWKSYKKGMSRPVREHPLRVTTELVAVLALTGTGLVGAVPDYEVGEQESGVAEGYNALGADLGGNLMDKTGPRENIVYSPLSIGVVFSLVYEGADGESRRELERLLRVEQGHREGNLGLLKSLNNPEPNYTYRRMLGIANKIETNVANGVWIREDLEYEKSYSKLLSKYYQAKVSEGSFDSGTKRDINGWVSQRTGGEINRIVEDLKPSDAVALVNAVYFNGDWEEPFEQEDTEKEDFNLRDNSTIKVDMMEKSETNVQYMAEGSGVTQALGTYIRSRESSRDPRLQVVRLPYGETGRIGMYVILPRNISSYVESWNQSEFDRIRSEMSRTEINLHMPKFSAKKKTDLEENLKEIGASQIFKESDDWDRISDKVTRVDRAKHKATVEVDEKGTEAAATSVVLTQQVSSDIEPTTMRVDRPFMFLIEDKRTNAILFQGIIQNPS